MSAAGTVMRLAADGDGRAVLFRNVEIAADLGEMPLVDQRPDFGGGIEGMTDLQPFTRAVSFSMNLSTMLCCTSRRLEEVQRSPLSE